MNDFKLLDEPIMIWQLIIISFDFLEIFGGFFLMNFQIFEDSKFMKHMHSQVMQGLLVTKIIKFKDVKCHWIGQLQV